jgi:predicted metal-dependent phosphoesterase TrpH
MSRTIPACVSALVLLSALAADSPLRSTDPSRLVDAQLRLPFAYVVFAPYCDLLDALAMLSVRQHVAAQATVLAMYLAWRLAVVSRGRRAAVRHLPRELARAGGPLLAMAGVYAVLTLAPRPMARLALRASSELVVDFHSHTSTSHDGRRRFDVRENRAWHRDAGFDVGYVSDHGTRSALVSAMAENPLHAGAGTMILPAIEVRCRGQHLVLLGPDALEQEECDAREPGSSGSAADAGWRDDRTVAVLTIPGALRAAAGLPHVQAIEIVDGAPRALDQMHRDGAVIQRIADSAGLATVTGSNNHGWTRTAVAWSVLRVPGWRSLDGRALDVAIRKALFLGHPGTIRVIERRRAEPASTVTGLSLTVPAVVWTMLRALSVAERASWIAWAWGGWALLALVRRLLADARDVEDDGDAAGPRSTEVVSGDARHGWRMGGRARAPRTPSPSAVQRARP